MEPKQRNDFTPCNVENYRLSFSFFYNSLCGGYFEGVGSAVPAIMEHWTIKWLLNK